MNADLSGAINRWQTECIGELSHPNLKGVRAQDWYAAGGIACQPRTFVGDDWENIAPATGVLLTHTALVSR
jgi:hypothetical protein